MTAGQDGYDGFDEFFVDGFAPLSRLAFLLTGSSAVADEIAQDACEQVYRRWAHVEHPRAYARAAVVNGARAWGRRRKRSRERPSDVRHAPAEADPDAVLVRQVLAGLSMSEREVLVLRYYADLKIGDIARELGLPEGTVKSHIHRGLTRMREELR